MAPPVMCFAGEDGYRGNTMVVDDSVKLMGEVNEQILEDGYATRERNLHRLLQKKTG